MKMNWCHIVSMSAFSLSLCWTVVSSQSKNAAESGDKTLSPYFFVNSDDPADAGLSELKSAAFP